ncbi:MAG: TIGR00730 family Rossman fold protein [Crocinitomicaceae bacterium]|nr:TIGR00730 family Rossman fold protein [Crocinitomicaceae bacterium]MBK8924752.1 TIGR00730 family Rossman fold protein [Crocinitomicaceae bacterium]
MINKFNQITVFCGSSSGDADDYTCAAKELGKLFAQKNIRLIYGGGSIGLMGTVADAVLENGGEVTGVIPEFLGTKEIAHHRLTELIRVETMHERKMKMNELAEGFIILPGGIGTMEEFFEILTWAQLGLHQKPIGILNVAGYYDDLIHFMQQMTSHGFLKPEHLLLMVHADNAKSLLAAMAKYEPPKIGKIITGERT